MRFLLLLSALVLSTAAGTVESLANQCCATLSNIIPNNVFFPNDTAYMQEEITYYSAQQTSQKPACRVSPTTAREVSQIIDQATRLGCHFAVRSGGHMNWKGSSNIGPSGFTIDLEQLNSVSLSSDQKTATLQPGAPWSQVYDTLSPLNLTVVGGRASTVGVGGFLMGEIVLSNGTIVTASANENADLHWALGLGSTNYGVVTSYTLETFPLGDMWGGTIALDISQAPAILNYLANFTLKLATPSADDDAISVSTAYLLPVSFPPLFSGLEPFVPDATSDTLTITNITAITADFAAGDPSGFRTAWWTLTFELDPQTVLEVFQYGQELFSDLVAVNGTQWSLNIQPINQDFIKATEAANNPAGLEGDNLFLILEHVIWTDASLDDVIEARSREFLAWAEFIASERGVLNRFLYLNYADGSQPIYKQIGSSNLAGLQEVKRQYDPDNLLGRLWKGGFKLP
ncbi:predicted protein [Postia placenta Mad-698-R]|nr:predicted protein [Postia placenta Mad-698-R]